MVLDTSAHVGYSQLHGSGFTDGNGAVWGDFDGRTSRSPASPRKCPLPIMARGTTCRPLSAVVSITISRPRTNIGVPAQAGFGATDLVIFGLPRDIGWAEAGLTYWSFSDISVTLAANYNVSELGSGYGGRPGS